jgi:hypothetical protein
MCCSWVTVVHTCTLLFAHPPTLLPIHSQHSDNTHGELHHQPQHSFEFSQLPTLQDLTDIFMLYMTMIRGLLRPSVSMNEAWRHVAAPACWQSIAQFCDLFHTCAGCDKCTHVLKRMHAHAHTLTHSARLAAGKQ